LINRIKPNYAWGSNTEVLAAITLCRIPIYVACDTPQVDAGSVQTTQQTKFHFNFSLGGGGLNSAIHKQFSLCGSTNAGQ